MMKGDSPLPAPKGRRQHHNCYHGKDGMPQHSGELQRDFTMIRNELHAIQALRLVNVKSC